MAGRYPETNIRELWNLVAKLAMATADRQITGAEVVAELGGEHWKHPVVLKREPATSDLRG
ncbi:MAG: hypothetical protein ACHP9V_06610 [Terriglobales bacterium]